MAKGSKFTIRQIAEKYRVLIEKDIDEILYSMCNSEKEIEYVKKRLKKIIEREYAAMDIRAAGKNITLEKKIKENEIKFNGLIEILESHNILPKAFLVQLYTKYFMDLPDTDKDKKVIKQLILGKEESHVFLVKDEEYPDSIENSIFIDKNEKYGVDDLEDKTLRELLNALIRRIRLEELHNIINEKYGDDKKIYGHIIYEIAVKTIKEQIRKGKVDESKLKGNLGSRKGFDEILGDDDETDNLLLEYLGEELLDNLQLLNINKILMCGAIKIIKGIKVIKKEENGQIDDLNGLEEKEAMRNTIKILKHIYVILERRNFRGEFIYSEDENSKKETLKLEDIKDILDRCTECEYLSYKEEEEIKEKLEKGILPEDLSKLKIPNVEKQYIADVVSALRSSVEYSGSEEKIVYEIIEKGLKSKSVTIEDLIDLFLEEQLNLEQLKLEDMKALGDEYFDNKLEELYGRYYTSSEEKEKEKLKLERFVQIYKCINQLTKAEKEDNDIVERILANEKFDNMEKVIFDLFELKIIKLETALQWLGPDLVEKLYSEGEFKPTDIRKLFDEGKIHINDLITMIKRLSNNTEKFTIIASIFPESEKEENGEVIKQIREKLTEECFEVDKVIASKRRGESHEKDHVYLPKGNEYVTDPYARFALFEIIDKDYILSRMTSDGHAIIISPRRNEVIIEKMFSATNNTQIEASYGNATYILPLDYFEAYKDEIIVDDKILRSKIVEDTEIFKITKFKHDINGKDGKKYKKDWTEKVLEHFDIGQSTREDLTPEEQEYFEKIDTIIDRIRDSKTRR